MSMNKSVMIVGDVFDFDATASDLFVMVMPHGIHIQDVQIVYSEATDAAIAALGVFAIDYLSTVSGASRVEKGSYTAELSKAIGFAGQLLSSSNPVNFLAEQGSTIYFQHVTAQTSGEAGAGRYILYGFQWPDAVVS